MKEYKTTAEKAAEWGVTPYHAQLLCRKGKIEGAIKRAGTWFIPDDTPSPVKYMKSGAKSFDFVGTRKEIFESAIELFKLKGFNGVSLRDIAEQVGIRQSTIYNHFNSKQEILDAIYDYYCHYYLKDRPSLEDMESALKNESIMDIIGRIRYEFKEDYSQKLSDITKIIFQRISIDDRANEIAKSLMVKEGVEYVEAVFNKAVEMGRFAPFDTHAMSVFINNIRLSTLHIWIIDSTPETLEKVVADEMTLYQYATRFITDLTPKA